MAMSPGRHRKAVYLLFTLIILAGAGGVVGLKYNADSTESAPDFAAAAEPMAPLDIAEQVEITRPALRAIMLDGVTEEVVERVRSVEGVGASARVLLANIVVEVPGGDAQVSIAAVDPEEFRPLTPESTAQARFVWEGLHRSQTLIAHEQYQFFGGQPLQTLAAQGPSGRHVLQIGGLASSGVPNLAGALMSMDQAEKLGLTTPTTLLVGLTKDARSADVIKALAEVLPGVSFERTQAAANNFFSGSSAQRALGNFRYVANEDGSISQDRQWVAQHITNRTVPLLGEVRCHRAMLPQLEAALTEIRDSGLSGSIKPEQYGGCYVPRFIERDGSRPLSMHAWGLAVDINVADNPAGARPTMDPQVVAIFEKWGFRWGGTWAKPDGHHFELAALIQG